MRNKIYKPLIASSYFGGIIFSIGIISAFGVLIRDFINKVNPINIYSMFALSLIMFGLIFIILGMMGEYIGRMFDESKNRPLYIIDEIINYEEKPQIYEVIN